MLDAAVKALAQMFSPPFRMVLAKSIGLALILIILFGIGLHQLRRHHQRVALPDFQSLGERHIASKNGPLLAYLLPGPLYTASTRSA